jgi:repressor LexA
MTLPLTVSQEKVWRYIDQCERSPSFDQVAADLGWRSKSNVAKIVEALEAKGYIRRTHNRARSLVAVNPQADIGHISTADLAAELARRLAG